MVHELQIFFKLQVKVILYFLWKISSQCQQQVSIIIKDNLALSVAIMGQWVDYETIMGHLYIGILLYSFNSIITVFYNWYSYFIILTMSTVSACMQQYNKLLLTVLTIIHIWYTPFRCNSSTFQIKPNITSITTYPKISIVCIS